jgi:hypothetical protein
MGRRRSEKDIPLPYGVEEARRWVKLYALWTAACKVVHMDQQLDFETVHRGDVETAIMELARVVDECRSLFGE